MNLFVVEKSKIIKYTTLMSAKWKVTEIYSKTDCQSQQIFLFLFIVESRKQMIEYSILFCLPAVTNAGLCFAPCLIGKSIVLSPSKFIQYCRPFYSLQNIMRKCHYIFRLLIIYVGYFLCSSLLSKHASCNIR